MNFSLIDRKAKKGMWKNATLELPADYKKRMAAMDPIATPLAAKVVPPKKAAKATK
jgi:hypothetical protein